ncbi:MAG TPA: hypothetical protein VGO31_10515 [Microbacteriaceae bacterium]|jgi:hypothetical protein|nr:hypothetical protein [Microbacteriaceae bacterium]
MMCLATATALVAGAASEASAGRNAMPPNNVYTCSWIAANPAAAAAARVSCDPASIFWASITPPIGDAPQTASAPSSGYSIYSLSAPLSVHWLQSRSAPLSGKRIQSVCGAIPAGGNVGTGVFAWTGYHSSNFWSFTASLAQSYTEYVQKTDGTNVRNHSFSDDVSHTETGLPTLSYRWGAQNHGSWAMNWAECYDTQ